MPVLKVEICYFQCIFSMGELSNEEKHACGETRRHRKYGSHRSGGASQYKPIFGAGLAKSASDKKGEVSIS